MPQTPFVLFKGSQTFLVAPLLLLVTQPFPKNGGMAEDHGALEARHSPGSGPEVVQR